MDKISRLRLVQLLSLKVLKNLVSFLDENQIRYYIVAGTLLGAFRHKGFIPWDTDIDIAIPRSDYARLQSLSIDNIIITNSEKVDRHYLFNRAVLSGTKIKCLKNPNYKLNDGIFVDIFPLDDYRNSVSATDQFINWIFKALIRKISFSKGRKHSSVQSNTVVSWFIYIFTFWVPNSTIVKYYTKFCMRDKGGCYYNNFHSKYGLYKQHFSHDIYGCGRTVSFEGIDFTAPREAELWLAQIYGDYMKMPKNQPDPDKYFEANEVDFGPYKFLLDHSEEEVYAILFERA